MNLSELLHLTHWINREIVNQQILQRYERMQQILQVNSAPNQPRQPFETPKDDLIEGISKVPLDSLSVQQYDFLVKIGIGANIGESAVKNVEDILFRNAIDPATAAQKFKAIIEEIKGGLATSDQLLESLEGIVPLEPALDKRVLIRITFANNAAIKNVVDLKTWANIWHDIGRGVAMINDSSPEQIEVIGADSGSVVIELAVGYGIAKTLSNIMLEALKVAEKVVDIMKKAEEVRGLKLSNTKIAKELEDEAAKEKSKGIALITDHVSKVKKKKDANEGDKVAALDNAVKNLVDFIEKGGSVDCVLPETPPEEEAPEATEIKQLRATFKEIRQLEFNIKQLEDKKDPHQEPS